LSGHDDNDGPASVTAVEATPTAEQLAHAAAQPPNKMQHALNTAALQLPTAGAHVGAHVQRLTTTTDPTPTHPSVQSAAEDIAAHIKAFLGGL
jgi:phospholipase C